MSWSPITLAEAIARGPIDYTRDMIFNVHPDVVWNTKPNAAGLAPTILCHHGDLTLDTLVFDTNHFVSPEADMLVIEGDLTLTGDLVVDQWDVGTPGYLLVTGSLHAKNLFLTQQFELLVWGDVEVEGVIHAHEASGGRLRCQGLVRAPLVALERYGLRAGALEGTAFVQLHWSDSEPDDIRLDSDASGRIVGVRPDDEYGEYWLLALPDGVAMDDLGDEALAEHCILTPEALAQYDAAGGPLSLQALLKQYGAEAVRPALREPRQQPAR